jgi:hypothetical protein
MRDIFHRGSVGVTVNNMEGGGGLRPAKGSVRVTPYSQSCLTLWLMCYLECYKKLLELI